MFSLYLIVTLSLAQLTTQSYVESPSSLDNLAFTVFSHREKSGEYKATYKLKDFSGKLPDNAKLEVKAGISEEQKAFIIEATYSVSLRPYRGYKHFPGVGSYKFYSEGTTLYEKAMETCANDGAHLAIINSDEEMEILKAMYAEHPEAYGFAYIGFNDIEDEGNYVTMFGESLSSTGYDKWKKGEPNNHNGDEDCGSMHRDGGLNDASCDSSHLSKSYPFFCEY